MFFKQDPLLRVVIAKDKYNCLKHNHITISDENDAINFIANFGTTRSVKYGGAEIVTGGKGMEIISFNLNVTTKRLYSDDIQVLDKGYFGKGVQNSEFNFKNTIQKVDNTIEFTKSVVQKMGYKYIEVNDIDFKTSYDKAIKLKEEMIRVFGIEINIFIYQGIALS